MTPVLLNGEPGMDKLRNNSIVKKKFLETGSAFIYISFKQRSFNEREPPDSF